MWTWGEGQRSGDDPGVTSKEDLCRQGRWLWQPRATPFPHCRGMKTTPPGPRHPTPHPPLPPNPARAPTVLPYLPSVHCASLGHCPVGATTVLWGPRQWTPSSGAFSWASGICLLSSGHGCGGGPWPAHKGFCSQEEKVGDAERTGPGNRWHTRRELPIYLLICLTEREHRSGGQRGTEKQATCRAASAHSLHIAGQSEAGGAVV